MQRLSWLQACSLLSLISLLVEHADKHGPFSKPLEDYWTSPSLETLKTHLHTFLCNLLCHPALAGAWARRSSEVPLNPNHNSVILWTSRRREYCKEKHITIFLTSSGCVISMCSMLTASFLKSIASGSSNKSVPEKERWMLCCLYCHCSHRRLEVQYWGNSYGRIYLRACIQIISV